VQIADVVGFLVNQVPLRLRPKSNVTFSQLVQATAATLGEALSHARVPFQQVVESLGSSRDAGRHPLFDVAFTAHSAPLLSGSQAPLEMQVIDVPCHSALLDLEVLVQFREQDVLLNWRYDTHLFAEQSIARIARSFVNLVRSASNSPESVLGSLPLAAPSDIAEAYRVGLGPVCDGAAQTVVDALASVTRERGSSTAVVDELGTLTYSGLFEAVERYATGLVGAGVEAGDVVAVCLERSSRLLIAMLGAFRVGAIHLAIDPRFPPARIARMVTRSRCRLLVSTHSLEGQTRALRDVNVIDYSSITRGGTATLPKPPSADAPAYVIFTSGSTGEPKGAVVGHRGMFNHLRAKIEDLRLSVGDTCLQTASQGFDISVWQFLASLLAGGRLVIVPAAVAEDPRALWSTVQEQQAAMLQTVPSMLSAILDEVEAHGLSTCPLRWLISTGEALPPELARRWLRHFPQIPLVNAYGPAECSDDVTHAFITAPQDQRCAHMPIGKPIRGAQLIVVNERLEPLPVGLAGELVVAGVVVGHGYMRSPRDSARAFVPDFFSGVASARCYRTGDVVRWNAAGELEFLCRVDQQVKLRGMRVDLGEIEAAILGFGDCRAAVVVPMRRGATVASLMACVVPKHSGGIAESGLLEKLSSLLPPYMIPAQLHVFADLPINANGKVDRQLLQKMVEPRDSPQTLTATASYAESLVADLWAELLKVPRADIGRESDFFLLGGHSILAARLVRRLEDVASTTVPLALVFQQTKLAAFAQRLLLVPHRAGA
jgi:surfactin family lipopeptide synthetase A/gramicidin S synthase 2